MIKKLIVNADDFGLSEGVCLGILKAHRDGILTSTTCMMNMENIEKYFEAYPGIKVYIDELVAFAKEHGYSLTMFNRRRPIPEIKSSNFMQRSFGERVAMNAPIQGTAADIIKLAMIEVYNRLKERGLKSRLILQVHDELLVEAHQDEVEEVKQLMTDAMKNAAKLAVVLEVDLKEGKNWLEAH